MHEMNIRSSFLQEAIANMIEKLIDQKTGYRPDIHFNDPIRITYDGEKAVAHVNLDLELKREDLEGMLQGLM